MRLSTSTNILDAIDGRQNATVEECLTRCQQCGFKVFDLNLCDQGRPGGFLSYDNWESRLDSICQKANELGVEFSQTHLEFYNVCDMNVPNRKWLEELVRRGIITTNRVGAKWAVLHTGSVYNGSNYSAHKSKQANIEYLMPHLDFAAENGVGLAVENVPDRDFRRFSGSVEELIDLVDTINAPNLGICWDFGHAHLSKLDQPYWLHQIGSRLKAVHVADNNGLTDEHLAPFYGTINWASIAAALKDIGYTNDFTYEIHNMTLRLPDVLRETQLKHLLEIGNYLLHMIKD